MKLPKLPNPASVLEAKYTAEQMREYAKRVQLMEREACAKICDEWANGLSGEPEMVEMAAEIRARGQA